jgi:hypothetical protein
MKSRSTIAIETEDVVVEWYPLLLFDLYARRCSGKTRERIGRADIKVRPLEEPAVKVRFERF